MHFSVQKNSIIFCSEFPASENHFLNYRETYLKPLIKPLDIPVNGSSFSI